MRVVQIGNYRGASTLTRTEDDFYDCSGCAAGNRILALDEKLMRIYPSCIDFRLIIDTCCKVAVILSAANLCSGGRTRTDDLGVMNPSLAAADNAFQRINHHFPREHSRLSRT